MQVWYLSSTSSPSILVWKPIAPLQDIRYIGSDPYVLSIHADEPSWILARSAAHPQVRSRINGKVLAYGFLVMFNKIYPPSQQLCPATTHAAKESAYIWQEA
jgi:hypothetical protein